MVRRSGISDFWHFFSATYGSIAFFQYDRLEF